MIFGLFGALAATSRSAGGALYTLYTHDDQRAQLIRDPALIPDAIEECLRIASNGYFTFARIATRDTEVGGTAIRKGMVVRPSPLAANYDPDVFPDPLRFDIHRKPKRIVSFAVGPHHCVGNILGRTTITIAIRRAAGALSERPARRPGLRAGLRRRGRRTAPAKPADEDAMSPLAFRRSCPPSSSPAGCCQCRRRRRRNIRASRIRLIVPYAPGGVPDTTARLLAQRLQDRVGQTRGGGEPRRRQRQRRGRRDRRGAGGRLHAACHRHHAAVGQSVVHQPALLQSAEGFRADRGAGAHAAVSRGAARRRRSRRCRSSSTT